MYNQKIKPSSIVPVANKTDRTSAEFVDDAILHMAVIGLITNKEAATLFEKSKLWREQEK